MDKNKETLLDVTEVRELLAKDVAQFDSQGLWCVKNQVSTAYLSDVLNGRREPGKKILEVLGMEAITVYRKKSKETHDTR